MKAHRRWFLRLLGARRRRSRARGGCGGKRRRRRGGRGSRNAQAAAVQALGTFGTRMGRHAGIYGSGQAGSLLLGLVTLAVLTRFLEPAQFGEYALYSCSPALLSVIYTLGWVRGS